MGLTFRNQTADQIPTTVSKEEEIFVTPNYKVVIREYTGEEIVPWRNRNFVVVHRHYNVVASLHVTVHDAIINAKAAEEATGHILANSHKSIKELAEGPPANVPLLPKMN